LAAVSCLKYSIVPQTHVISSELPQKCCDAGRRRERSARYKGIQVCGRLFDCSAFLSPCRQVFWPSQGAPWCSGIIPKSKKRRGRGESSTRLLQKVHGTRARLLWRSSGK
jgi:hypothetical protein